MLHLSRDVEGTDPWDFSHDLTLPSQICVLCIVGFRLGQSMFLSFTSYHLAFSACPSFISPVPSCGGCLNCGLGSAILC